MPTPEPTFDAAEIELAAAPLDATVAFFTERLGFRVESVQPADDPRVVVVSGHGLTVRLARDGAGGPGVLRLRCAPGTPLPAPAEATAPNGTRVVFVSAAEDDAAPDPPPLSPSLVVSRAADAQWTVGRAGMRYRDLDPSRQGGRFVASHIRIEDGGPVPDRVHFHRVRFQTIACVRGSVELVYEEQGRPFTLAEGDVVLQPPGIRHRVLECTPGLEVVEVASPASHPTTIDHDLALPTPSRRPDRTFGGQRFVRHEARGADWRKGPADGWESCATGLGAASGGAGDVRFLRVLEAATPTPAAAHDHAFALRFVLEGAVTLEIDGRAPVRLAPSDAAVVPAGLPHSWSDATPGLRLLEVTCAE